MRPSQLPLDALTLVNHRIQLISFHHPEFSTTGRQKTKIFSWGGLLLFGPVSQHNGSPADGVGRCDGQNLVQRWHPTLRWPDTARARPSAV